ncbi:MAG: DUF1801 domain-containing protein, partial [Halioglobus sp.]|nr:DUF1801 domain-containing protein [Halioglobus sp.]
MTLDEYVRAVPAQRRERFDAIRALIKRRYPQADESMRYRMPTFELEGGGWVALANQKQYISLYTCAAQHLEPFKARYPGIKTG